jgi:hypothetical protein
MVEANYKKYLETQNGKSAPQNDDDDLGDLTIEVISN